MVNIIATQRMPYGKRRYEAGEEIQGVSEKDAKLLVGIGKAKLCGGTSPTDLPKAAIQPSAMAVSAPEGEIIDVAPEVEDTFVEEAAPEASADPRTDTRDIAQPAGRTGAVKPSRSSRPGRRQNRRT